VPVGQPAAVSGLNYLLTVLKTQNIFCLVLSGVKAVLPALAVGVLLHLFISLGVNPGTLVPVSKELP